MLVFWYYEKTLASFCSRIILSGFTHHCPSSCPQYFAVLDWSALHWIYRLIKGGWTRTKSGFPCNPSFQWAFYLLRSARDIFLLDLSCLWVQDYFSTFKISLYLYMYKKVVICLIFCTAFFSLVVFHLVLLFS